jgi:hypothetical protein
MYCLPWCACHCCCWQAEKTSRKAQLADRLVNGLSGENKRWSETIKKMEETGGKLVSCCCTQSD